MTALSLHRDAELIVSLVTDRVPGIQKITGFCLWGWEIIENLPEYHMNFCHAMLRIQSGWVSILNYGALYKVKQTCKAYVRPSLIEGSWTPWSCCETLPKNSQSSGSGLCHLYMIPHCHLEPFIKFCHISVLSSKISKFERLVWSMYQEVLSWVKQVTGVLQMALHLLLSGLWREKAGGG